MEFGGLKKENLIGSISYYYGCMDDSRINVMLIITAYFYDAKLANYVKLINFHFDQERITHTLFEDEITGETFKVFGKVFINATGPS